MTMLQADVPFEKTKTIILIPWIVGFMMYLFILSGYMLTAAQHLMLQWNQGFSSHLTVEIPPQSHGAHGVLTQKIDHLITALQRLSYVKKAQVLSQSDLQALLSPWFGVQEEWPKELDLPTFVDITLDEEMATDTSPIVHTVQSYFPDAQLMDQREWQHSFLSFLSAIQVFGFLLSFLICLASVFTMIFTMQSHFLVNLHIVDILYLVGASHCYIVRQFGRQALALNLKSFLISLLFMGLTLVIISLMMSGMTVPDYATPHIPLIVHGALLASPLLLVGIVTYAARLTVMRSLLNA